MNKRFSAFVLLVFLAAAATVLILYRWPALTQENHSSSTIYVSTLPSEARAVYKAIHDGGSFHYEKDGAVFFNREKFLPERKRGYYREYTVRTPGLKTRGAKRIVCGGAILSQPDQCYYTSDHYSSFKTIIHP